MNLYEVGDIFLTMSTDSPALRFIGTWELIAKGRTLVGVDPNDTDFNTVQKTGGEKAHTLTIVEMPSHNHRVRNDSTGGGANQFTTKASVVVSNTYNTQVLSESTGGSQAHNNMQPYLTCYIWCRTA